jgi:hypothetical protein
MNEKLYKLLQESKVSISSPRLFHGEIDIEKFAELIVQECAEIAEAGWAAPGIQIKRHFGVEE